MDIQEESGNSQSNILLAVWRYKLHLILSIPILILISITIVFMIPPTFRSTGLIMVQTQQIPVNLVQSTVTSAASEQIDIITQRVLTKEKIEEILKSHEYFQFEKHDLLSQSQILDDFRKNVGVEVTSAKSGRQEVAIGFSVSFISANPVIAKDVATQLTNLFLIENVKARTTRASETTEFLYSEAEKMREKLEEIEGEVAEFKRVNKDSLPEHLNLYVGMREDSRRSLASISEALYAKDDQIKALQNQLTFTNSKGVVSPLGMGFEKELATLRDEYRMLSLEYQPDHPDLVILRQKIELLEKGDVGKEVSHMESEAHQKIESQLSTMIEQRKYMEEEKTRISEKLVDLEQRIIQIPQVEREFTEINRNYQTIEEQYKSLQSKAQSAAMAESLENQQKAERFDLLEEPTIPVREYKPDRKKLSLVAIGISFGMPFGIIVLIGLLDKSIRDSDALSKITGVDPIVEIPFVFTPNELSFHRKKIIGGICCFILLIGLGLTTVNFFVMPLDMIAAKMFTRFGV